MASMTDVRAQKLILTAYRRCEFWKQRKQCAYCAFFTSGKTDPVLAESDAREIVVAAIKEPGRFSELYFSGGSDSSGSIPFENEVNRYIRILQAVGQNFSGRFPCQLMAPAYPIELVRRIRQETGITSYSPNIELADRAMFERRCPGKNEVVGYDEWINRTLKAVDVFGAGHVYSQIVAGAELVGEGVLTVEQALETNLKLCEFFADHGVILLSTIWRPHRASRLGMTKMAPLEYYVQLAAWIGYAWNTIRSQYYLLEPKVIIVMIIIRTISAVIFAALLTKLLADGLAKAGVVNAYALGQEKSQPMDEDLSDASAN